MGLSRVIVMIGFIGLVGEGCVPVRNVTPADQNATRQIWRLDCCDPALLPGSKDLCKMAAGDADHVLWDTDGNRYEFVWSDCGVGREKWREWED